MKAYSLIAGIVLLVFPLAHAQSLTPAQKEHLYKQLTRLLEQTTEAEARKRSSAHAAFQRAMGSSSESLDLYLKCVEKVDFIDQGKSSSDFREWRRTNAEKLSDSGFRLALRYQLRWLVLSLEASKRGDDKIHTLGGEAREIVTSLLSNADDLMEHRQVVSQNVVQSHFAKAYGFTKLEAKKWPTSPVNIQAIYKSVILPELLKKKSATQVRSAWMELIRFEELRTQQWTKTKSSKIGMKKNMGSAAYAKWRSVTYPEMIWSMEQDVLKAGGEYSALPNMVAHIGKNLSHPSALKWANELNALLEPEDSGSSVEAIATDTKPKVVPESVKEESQPPAPAVKKPSPKKSSEDVIKKSGYIELSL